MEDQRSGSGDLSDGAAESSAEKTDPTTQQRVPRGKRKRAASTPAPEPVVEPDVTDEPEATEEPEAAEEPEAETDKPDATEEPEAEPDKPDATEEPEAEPDEPDAEPVVLVERKLPGRRAGLVIGIAAALFVAAGGFAGAMAQPYIAERATVHTKVQIARTAADAITTLWTYTPDNMDQLANRSARYLAGDFQAEYRKYIDAIVPTNKQAQVTNSTEVVGAAVESLNGSEATAIVYTNSTSTSPLTKDIPSLKYISYRLTLQRESGQWLVTGMTAITNLDLTPQI